LLKTKIESASIEIVLEKKDSDFLKLSLAKAIIDWQLNADTSSNAQVTEGKEERGEARLRSGNGQRRGGGRRIGRREIKERGVIPYSPSQTTLGSIELELVQTSSRRFWCEQGKDLLSISYASFPRNTESYPGYDLLLGKKLAPSFSPSTLRKAGSLLLLLHFPTL
jgi:hypothetical protein